jgi:hypothetical protein
MLRNMTRSIPDRTTTATRSAAPALSSSATHRFPAPPAIPGAGYQFAIA